ncbi:isoamylase 1 [Citrus sinensis]|uniref:Isoamylase 1 n=1 Tax=Citrus sinensis TaxID=2711 RepID=A0ACB8P798_CITSI|nr:isoamylase 1 [Citrus sinensis]
MELLQFTSSPLLHGSSKFINSPEFYKSKLSNLKKPPTTTFRCCNHPNKTSHFANSKAFENVTKNLVIRASKSAELETAVIKKPQSQRFQVSKGYPTPFGATLRDGGVNFSIFSSNAVSATLCLITLSDLQENKVTEEIALDSFANKTGDVWHVFLKGDFKDMLYGYKFDGKFSPQEGHYFDPTKIVLDPYAKAVISRAQFGVLGPDENCWPQMACLVPTPEDEFDWEGDLPLKYPQRDLIIYEVHVRGFTRHESSKSEHPGTYLGVVEKLDHLKDLGINCLELMPCHEFNELEYFSYNSVLGDYKVNFWGYSTINYFSPMIRYSSAGIRNCGHDAINEFKLLVKEAHKRGIEVVMDVVFNHTVEGNDKGPILSFRGVDNSVYYMLAPKIVTCLVDVRPVWGSCAATAQLLPRPILGEYFPRIGLASSCPKRLMFAVAMNTVFGGNSKLEVEEYWVTEMHVDGFRFDLASIMTRGSSLWDSVNVYGIPIEGDLLTTGTPLRSPPLIDLISNDPILRGVKLIAEAWDTGGLYQVGIFPHWGIWSEWNGKYRDIVRQFIKGTDGFAGAFAECLCGSPNLYQEGGRKPWNSINFVCAHDGFSLADLVSYNKKHNLANGEDNNDGETHNNSWNCGQEGEFANILVKKLRRRQMRNFFLCLMVSQGVPMISMGDEYGHTKGGNNNTYCHDNDINYFRWDKKEESKSDFFRFCCLLTKFRHECESLGLSDFPTADRLQWHGHAPGLPDWSDKSRFVAFTLIDSVKGEIYVAFNASHLPVIISLPKRPGYRWEPLVDTSKPEPFDFLSSDLPAKEIAIKQYAPFLDANLYPMLSYSSIILLLSPDENA